MEDAEVLAYADDIAIMVSDLKHLEQCIRIAEEWGALNGIAINKAKSGILDIRLRRSKAIDTSPSMIMGIPIVKLYKFLGLQIDYTGCL